MRGATLRLESIRASWGRGAKREAPVNRSPLIFPIVGTHHSMLSDHPRGSEQVILKRLRMGLHTVQPYLEILHGDNSNASIVLQQLHCTLQLDVVSNFFSNCLTVSCVLYFISNLNIDREIIWWATNYRLCGLNASIGLMVLVFV